MSSYMSFYIKTPIGYYAPLMTFCRSTEVYQNFENYAPYEKVAALTHSIVSYVRSDVNASIKNYMEAIDRTKESIEFLKQINAPLDEIVEQFECNQTSINEFRESIERLKEVINFCDTLGYIMDEYRYEYVDGKYVDFSDESIYFGIEVNPNAESEE